MESRDEARFWPPRDSLSLSLSETVRQETVRCRESGRERERERERERLFKVLQL